MPEGDSLHRAARHLQVLVGERVSVETPHPRAAAAVSAERLDGRRLEGVEAVGKNLLFSFEGGLVLRSHVRMSGRWQVVERGIGSQRPAVARALRRGARGIALERPRAGALGARRAPARARHPRGAARFRRDGREPAARVPAAGARRRAPRPARRGRRREHLEGRVALARAPFA
ncbi:MAG: hypothetical protein E6G15_04105 [Actinobacteria bacterium]|nr:MAG: hypothetical protein E6G15_04105 [Actinomycetota bacterium]